MLLYYNMLKSDKLQYANEVPGTVLYLNGSFSELMLELDCTALYQALF